MKTVSEGLLQLEFIAGTNWSEWLLKSQSRGRRANGLETVSTMLCKEYIPHTVSMVTDRPCSSCHHSCSWVSVQLMLLQCIILHHSISTTWALGLCSRALYIHCACTLWWNCFLFSNVVFNIYLGKSSICRGINKPNRKSYPRNSKGFEPLDAYFKDPTPDAGSS